MAKSFTKIQSSVTSVLLMITSVLFLYTAGFGTFSAMTQRAVLLALMGPVVFFSRKKGVQSKTWANIGNVCLALLILAANLYVIAVWQDRVLKVGEIPLMDIVVGSILVLLVLEATRRTTGWVLTLICVGFIGYALWGPYFPSVLAHRGETWPRLVNFLFMTTEGIYGIPLDVAATFILVFVIFGSFLETFGGGQWFVDVAYSLTGRFRGGPAKTAVIGSMLMGMISGSPAANVATTGCFTIPLMKQVGYKPHVAGAIEAVASTGGMFTPPIMGAGAFIMAQYLGVSYMKVVVAAIVPAFLYYLALMLIVDAQAANCGLTGLAKDKLPSLKQTILERGYLGIPVVFLIGAIVIGWSPMKTAFWATMLTVAVSFLNQKTRPDWKKLLHALEFGSKQVIPIVTACAAAGIIVGVFLITGLGAKLSYTLISLSHGNLYLAGFFTMLIALVLGCAMPPTAVYIILAAILVPALTKLGAVPIAAHMFIFIFSSIGAITPPVAIAAYTAAAIAEANSDKTGFTAFRFGFAAYLIPFMFLISPALLMQGTFLESGQAIFTGILGILSFVAAMEGFVIVPWNQIARSILGIAAILLLVPEKITDVIGIGLIIAAFVVNKVYGKASQPACKI
jgi:TRAP transporter 4TM/12TM fusion protein